MTEEAYRHSIPTSFDIRPVRRDTRQALTDLFSNMAFGLTPDLDPTVRLQITSFLRLLDHATGEYDSAAMAANSVLRGRSEARLAPFMECMSHYEDCIVSLDRLLRFAAALDDKVRGAFLKYLPGDQDRDRIRSFRNRIQHADEDIAQGKLAASTISVTGKTIELGGISIGLPELAAWLNSLNEMAGRLGREGLGPALGGAKPTAGASGNKQ